MFPPRLSVSVIPVLACLFSWALLPCSSRGSSAGEPVRVVRDSLTAEALIRQAEDTQRRSPDQALRLAARALDAAETDTTRASALSAMGIAHYNMGEYPEALEHYRQSLELARRSGHPRLTANALNNTGVIHYVRGEHHRALDHYFEAIALRMEIGDQDGLARGYNNVANVHQTAGRFAEALGFYNKALAVHRKLDNETMVAAMHNNIGLLEHERGNDAQAGQHFLVALEIAERLGDRPGMALSLNNLGQVAEEQGKLEEAARNYGQALALREKLGDRLGVSVCLGNLGEVFADRGQFTAAVEHTQRALAMAEELQVQELIRDALLSLAEIYEKMGDHEQALIQYRRYKEAHDRIFNEERAQQMAAAEARFQVNLKDREIEDLRREGEVERFRRQVLAVVAVLSLGILFLLLNRYLFQKRAHAEISRANTALQVAHADLERASRDELAHVARVATMGELAAAFAHELNQPLAAIKVNVRAGRNFLERERPDLSETTAALEDIGSDAERAQEIISRLRQMMRKGETRRELVDLNAAAADAAAFLEAERRKTGVIVVLERTPVLPPVAGDPIQLQQVILNLLQNALTAAVQSPQGRIKLETTEESGFLVLRVRDNGPPVDDGVLADLFEPFFSTKEQGLGMGLPICRTIVQAHEGEIEARRNGDGGLDLEVRLPPAG